MIALDGVQIDFKFYELNFPVDPLKFDISGLQLVFFLKSKRNKSSIELLDLTQTKH